ncbi:hypothetical protein DFP72DRAFT_1068362 [Ephemerocybe angulata]|uniref:Uncharacterized protein n=1 Tax=Ephemerocybe angulata TaxID=980116 RepID=A0A8H6HXM1_9AGAR|nr:hypothetical protein DFP72DRAFT_1068362 [Tulosesus angulatus]
MPRTRSKLRYQPPESLFTDSEDEHQDNMEDSTSHGIDSGTAKQGDGSNGGLTSNPEDWEPYPVSRALEANTLVQDGIARSRSHSANQESSQSTADSTNTPFYAPHYYTEADNEMADYQTRYPEIIGPPKKKRTLDDFGFGQRKRTCLVDERIVGEVQMTLRPHSKLFSPRRFDDAA